MLAEASGESPELWCAALADAGLQGLLLTPSQQADPEISRCAANAGLTVMQVGGLAEADVYFFALPYDETENKPKLPGIPSTAETLPAEQIVQSLNERGSLLVLVEREAQTGILLPEGVDAGTYSGAIAKGYWLNRWCRSSVGRLGYPGTEETENILFRAVIDRGIQVLWLSPVCTEDETPLTERSVYVQLLSGLETRLGAAGYAYGSALGYEPYEPPLWLLLAVGTAVLLACVLLLNSLFPLPSRALWGLLAACAAENLAGFLLLPGLQLTALALASAVCFPCLSAVLLWQLLHKTGADTPLMRRMLSGAALCMGVTLLGGLFIAALQSSRSFLLVLQLFRGVKLSQIAVYVFSLAFFFRSFLRRPCGERKKEPGRRGRRRFILAAVGLLVLSVGVGTVYLLRTGDKMLAVSVAEQRIRNLFEHILLFRPRTKEFLLGWPLLGLAFFFAHRERRFLSALCGGFSAVGFASVANTFCHSRAHVLVSLARTGIGFVLGVALSLLLTAILSLLWRNKKTGAAI